MVTCQVSTNLRCAIIAVIFVVSNNRPVSIYNSSTIFCGQFRNWDWPFHAISFSKKIYTTEAAIDLRNISRLVKTKTKTRAQCLMVNTGSLTMEADNNNSFWKMYYMKCGVWNQMKIWSSHLLDNLSNCLMNLKNSGDSTGFEPMTSAMPVQCSNQLSYEVTQLRAGQFVGLMFSRERNVVWKMYYMKCGVWNQMKIWSSHLLDNLSNCLMNLKNSGDSTGFEPMTSAMPVQCSNQLSYEVTQHHFSPTLRWIIVLVYTTQVE